MVEGVYNMKERHQLHGNERHCMRKCCCFSFISLIFLLFGCAVFGLLAYKTDPTIFDPNSYHLCYKYLKYNCNEVNDESPILNKSESELEFSDFSTTTTTTTTTTSKTENEYYSTTTESDKSESKSEELEDSEESEESRRDDLILISTTNTIDIDSMTTTTTTTASTTTKRHRDFYSEFSGSGLDLKDQDDDDDDYY